MQKNNELYISDLLGIYGEIAELINIENTIKIYEHFRGQQVSFPMRLYTKEYIIAQVNSSSSKSIKKLATQYGYSERRLRQILKEN